MTASIGTMPVPVHPDLAALAAGQAALFSSLAAFQAAWQAAKLGNGTNPVLGLCGLSLSLLRDGNCGASNLMLAHEAGGYIETVLAEGQAMHEAAEEILGLTLLAGLISPNGLELEPQTEAAPVVVTPVAPAEAPSQTCSLTPPAPPSPEPEATAAAPAAAPTLSGEDAPAPDAVAALFATLEELSSTDAAKVKAIVAQFKAQFDIGRTPFVRSIISTDRADALAALIQAQTAGPA